MPYLYCAKLISTTYEFHRRSRAKFLYILGLGTLTTDARRADMRSHTSDASNASIEKMTKRSSVALMIKSPATRGLGKQSSPLRPFLTKLPSTERMVTVLRDGGGRPHASPWPPKCDP